MLLTEDQAKQIIIENQQIPTWIQSARVQSDELFALVEGKKFTDFLINRIEKLESKDKAEARKKYSRDITDLFGRLLKPIDNVFSATGGSKNFDLTESQLKQFIGRISNFKGQKSVEKYVQDFWMKLYHTDPNGVIFMEYSTEEIHGQTNLKPTYKASKAIRNYRADGQQLEWVLFEPKLTKQGQKIWRIVDDLTDRFFLEVGQNQLILMKMSFEHPFGEVPGVVISDIVDIVSKIRISPIDKIIGLARELARDQSVKTIYKFTKGNPIHWRIVQFCQTCKGAGKDGSATCTDCNGKGKYQKQDVTDLVELPLPKKDDVKLAPDIAGFVSPDNETWVQYNNEIELLEILAHQTHWGTITAIREKVNSKTATEVFYNNQPMQNTLAKYSDSAEFIEQKLVNWVANFYIPQKAKDDQIARINYGRNYIIESEDILLAKYNEGRKDQQNNVILDRLLSEYLTSKYKNDPRWLRVELLKATIEPYVHQTIDVVNSIFGQEEARKKVWFSDWWESITLDDKLNKTAEQLDTEFNTFVSNKNQINK